MALRGQRDLYRLRRSPEGRHRRLPSRSPEHRSPKGRHLWLPSRPPELRRLRRLHRPPEGRHLRFPGRPPELRPPKGRQRRHPPRPPECWLLRWPLRPPRGRHLQSVTASRGFLFRDLVVWVSCGPGGHTWVPRSYVAGLFLPEGFSRAGPLAIERSPGVSRREGGPVMGAPIATPPDQSFISHSCSPSHSSNQLQLVPEGYKSSLQPALWTESFCYLPVQFLQSSLPRSLVPARDSSSITSFVPRLQPANPPAAPVSSHPQQPPPQLPDSSLPGTSLSIPAPP